MKRVSFTVALAVGLIVATLPLAAGAADPVYINEIQVSTDSTDWEFVEIQGVSGTDLSGYTLIGIESDAGSSTGSIDRVITLSGAIPVDGYWVATSPAAESAYGVTGDAAIANNSFENSTATYFLVTGFSGAAGDDLDTDDDGVLDSSPWTAIADSINIRDAGASDFDYGAPSVGPDGSYLPAGTYRCPNAPDGDLVSNLLSYSTPDGTPGTENCPPPADPVEKYIHEVQGDGDATPLPGVDVIVEGIVVGDFQGNDFAGWQLDGFFLQEELADQDDDPLTSEGIFVYAPSPAVSVGDTVKVTGTAVEYNGATQITDVTEVAVGDRDELPPATVVSLPLATDFDWEPLEGMLVEFPQDLYISEYYNFDRYGEIVLTTSRQYQPTQVAVPGSAEAEAIADANALSRVTIDDGRTSQNPDPAIHPNGDEFTLTNTFRGGDIVQGVTGVVHYIYGYKIEPTQPATHVVANPRPTAPDRIKGQLRVASFNVLNFFTTIDEGSWICGPTQDRECRGADSEEEYERQLAKLVSGIVALDADVVGLQEIENDIYPEATDESRAHNPVLSLVEALNAVEGSGTWAWVGPFDDLAMYNDYPVRNEIIYRTKAVAPTADPETFVDEAFDKTRPGEVEPVGRRPVAQTFTIDNDKSKKGDRRAFTVVVNHFKSKGSSCSSIGDPFDPNGQGNCNLTRVAQAEALLEFVESLQESSGDEDVLIIGDLNSYAMEDPVGVIMAGTDMAAGTEDDFTDLLQTFEGISSYGYLFDGQIGSLDHALASSSLVGQVRGVTTFHINADEPDIFDYDIGHKKPAQAALYEPLPYRVSDHDPVIVGLKLIRQDHGK